MKGRCSSSLIPMIEVIQAERASQAMKANKAGFLYSYRKPLLFYAAVACL